MLILVNQFDAFEKFFQRVHNFMFAEFSRFLIFFVLPSKQRAVEQTQTHRNYNTSLQELSISFVKNHLSQCSTETFRQCQGFMHIPTYNYFWGSMSGHIGLSWFKKSRVGSHVMALLTDKPLICVVAVYIIQSI